MPLSPEAQRIEHERSSIPPVRALADQLFARAAGVPVVEGNRVRLLKDAAENYLYEGAA